MPTVGTGTITTTKANTGNILGGWAPGLLPKQLPDGRAATSGDR